MARSGFRIARIAGININLDWSWILIFLLVTWQLGGGVFPYLHPLWGPGTVWSAAVVAALLFFGSVLAHELAHSLVSLSRGLPVRSITLFLFGGVSNIEREPPSAGTEFLIAIVGPLTSFLIGAICLYAGGVALVGAHAAGTRGIAAASGLSPASTLLLWLGGINLMLGIFNLVPAFPLDGGRVFRSIVWALTDSLRTATRWASGVGQVIAWAMIVAGLSVFFGVRLPLVGGGAIGGLWLAFIGWFLNNAAVASYRQLVVHDILEGVPVARLMAHDVAGVSPDLPLSALVYDRLMRSEQSCYPVLDGERLAGLVCLDDVRGVPRDQWDTTVVSQVMTPADRLAAVGPRDDLGEALARLSRRNVRQAPVVEGERLVGMIRLRDIARWLQLHADEAAEGGPEQRRAA